MKAFFAAPFQDTLDGLERCLTGPRHAGAAFVLVGVGLLLGWWIYVPIHELLHAGACLITGGEVTELEIAPLYGGALFAQLIPWVTAGGDYAGRLSGFDTHGSDLIYLATVFGPFLLTIFPGVWLLRLAGEKGVPLGFGAALPLGLAPFMSLTGDAYEIGSIVTTWLPPWSSEAARDLLRGDDLFLLAENLYGAGAGLSDWLAYGLATLLGLLWGLAVYALGSLVTGLVNRSAA